MQKIKKAKLKTKDKSKKLAEVKAYNKYITRAEGYVKGYKEATTARNNLNKLLVELEKTVATQDVTAILEQYAEIQVAIKLMRKKTLKTQCTVQKLKHFFTINSLSQLKPY